MCCFQQRCRLEGTNFPEYGVTWRGYIHGRGHTSSVLVLVFRMCCCGTCSVLLPTLFSNAHSRDDNGRSGLKPYRSEYRSVDGVARPNRAITFD